MLLVGLSSSGQGWLAVGFDPVRRMQGANVVIAAVSEEWLAIEDHYGASPISHRQDLQDHVLLAAGTESEAGTQLEFIIPLDSGDPQDRPLFLLTLTQSFWLTIIAQIASAPVTVGVGDWKWNSKAKLTRRFPPQGGEPCSPPFFLLTR